MFSLQVDELKRNRGKIDTLLTSKKESVIVNDTLYILFPKRWEKLGFIHITDTVEILGNFLIADEKGNATLSYVTTMVTTEPSAIESHLFGDEEYFLLVYEKGNAILKNRKVVQSSSYVFKLMEEYFIKGNIPPYFTYDDLFRTFINVRKYSGSDIADDPLGIAALTSMVSRIKGKTDTYFRLAKDTVKDKIEYIGLNKVDRAFSNTFARVTGNYLKKGIRASVIDDKEVKIDIEDIIL